eukprot:CAMPEP_0204114086 /NCGR_PEP_ID=MMETSP0361-20130328/4041_1 /ASSEMBLY_ACC=CAM_ASM_000343 /TAXON_ID=268821 /ORGANISM="Scrippsiella Hangoei, Strain SHTV-5" /LENGTH=100 /DNA_ID=CAMNT_0051064555 /DNA_START=139 /DNA_END=439 /DNA_ORIENTATION=+
MTGIEEEEGAYTAQQSGRKVQVQDEGKGHELLKMLEGVSKDAVELVIRKTVDLQQWPEEQWNKEHPRLKKRSQGFVEAALQKNGLLRKKEEQPLLLEEVV